MRRSSGGSGWRGKEPQEVRVPSASGGGGVGGRKVNELMGRFQHSNEQVAPSQPPSLAAVATSQPTGMSGGKPTPPPSSSKPTRRPPNLSSKPSPSPLPKKPLTSVDTTSTTQMKASSKGDSHNVDGEIGGGRKIKTPLLPLSSRGNFVSPSSKLIPARTDDGLSHRSVHSREGDGNIKAMVGGRGEEKEVQNGMVEGKGEKDEGAPASRISFGGRLLKKIHHGKTQHAGVKPHSSTDRKSKLVKTHSQEEALKLPSVHKQLSTSYNIDSHHDDKRQRADSADKAKSSFSSSSKTEVCGASSSPRRQHVPLKPCGENDGLPAPLSTPPPPPSQKRNPHTHVKMDYENVLPHKDSAHLSKVHLPPPVILMDQYESMEFSNRDSDVYENLAIGFAGRTGDLSCPMPPLPPSRDTVRSVQPVKQAYENVEIKKPLKKNKGLVEEDDDTLFGKEGPPGNQETIYENFGPDKGNRQMSVEELEAHVEKMGQKGLSTEYFKIRNEPICGTHKACRLAP